MLSLQKQQRKIIEKILRTKTGEYVRAVFLVTEIQGHFQAKLLSITPIPEKKSETSFKTSTVQSLPVGIVRHLFEIVHSFGKNKIVSPYFSLKFFISQLTRAPSTSC